jgi:superfamily II RNA helicase
LIIILSLQFSCSVGNVSSGSGLVNVDVIVLDEVHYLSDISRGTVWEEVVSMI